MIYVNWPKGRISPTESQLIFEANASKIAFTFSKDLFCLYASTREATRRSKQIYRQSRFVDLLVGDRKEQAVLSSRK